MKGADTKEQIIRIGAEVIGQGGFNATGIEAVLKRAKVPKGSFYYYFPSKEDFGLAVIDRAAKEFQEKLQSFLHENGTVESPLGRLRKYLESGLASIGSNQCKKGCLIGNLGQELAAQNEKFRKRLDEAFQSWRAEIAKCLDAAKVNGELAKESDTAQLSEFLLVGWEGAILRSKVMKSVKPMEIFIETLFEKVLR